MDIGQALDYEYDPDGYNDLPRSDTWEMYEFLCAYIREMGE